MFFFYVVLKTPVTCVLHALNNDIHIRFWNSSSVMLLNFNFVWTQASSTLGYTATQTVLCLVPLLFFCEFQISDIILKIFGRRKTNRERLASGNFRKISDAEFRLLLDAALCKQICVSKRSRSMLPSKRSSQKYSLNWTFGANSSNHRAPFASAFWDNFFSVSNFL